MSKVLWQQQYHEKGEESRPPPPPPGLICGVDALLSFKRKCRGACASKFRPSCVQRSSTWVRNSAERERERGFGAFLILSACRLAPQPTAKHTRPPLRAIKSAKGTGGEIVFRGFVSVCVLFFNLFDEEEEEERKTTNRNPLPSFIIFSKIF